MATDTYTTKRDVTDGLAWRAFEKLLDEQGFRTFHGAKERRKLRF